MSKEVYSVYNQKKFNVAMAVGYMTSLINNGRYSKETENWTYDEELSSLALTIYEEVKDKENVNDEACKAIDNFFADNKTIRNCLMLITDEDYQDFWNGVECGAYFGLATKESLEKCNEAMKVYMEDNGTKYPYLHYAIEDLYVDNF